jgi:hypothetical protein
LRRREGDSVAALAGFEGECDRQVSLAGARRTEEADVGVLLDPGQLGQVQHERALGVGLRRPVEVLECLQRGEAGVADAHPGAGGVAGEDLRLGQRLEEALVGPGLLARQGGGLFEPLEHARRLQLAKQVRQPLTRLRLRRAHAHNSA